MMCDRTYRGSNAVLFHERFFGQVNLKGIIRGQGNIETS